MLHYKWKWCVLIDDAETRAKPSVIDTHLFRFLQTCLQGYFLEDVVRWGYFLNWRPASMMNYLGRVNSVDCGVRPLTGTTITPRWFERGRFRIRPQVSCLIGSSHGCSICGDINCFREGVPLSETATPNGSQIVSHKVLKAAQQENESQAVSSQKKENARKTNGSTQNGVLSSQE